MLKHRTIPLLTALAFVWGCDDISTDPAASDGPGDIPASSNIVLTLTSGTAAGAGGFVLAGEEDGGNVPRDAVDAIRVTVTGVQVLPADEEGGWISLDLVLAEEEEGVTLDLLALGAADVTLAAGDLEPGDYVNARLFIAGPVIELNREVCVGDGAPQAVNLCLDEGENEVFIPSSMQTGIKTDARFTIPDNGGVEEVELMFDADATVRTITYAPGLGAVIVAPVIRAPDAEDEDEEGNGEGEENGDGEENGEDA